MTNTQHTPGPWIIGQNVSHEPTVRSADPDKDNGGFIICETFGTRKHRNARLIAACPEMLDALQAVADYWDGGPYYNKPDEVETLFRAAIAKAT